MNLRTSEEFLRALDRQANAEGILSETRQALRDEVASHLAASIQARLELGESPEEAEANAVVAFGPVRGFAQRVAQAHDPVPKGVSWPTLFCALLMVASIGFACLDPLSETHRVVATAGGYTAALGLAIAGFRARRIQGVPFVALVPLVWLGLATIFSTQVVTVAARPLGGVSMTSRDSLPQEIRLERHQVRVAETYLRQVDALHRAYLQDGSLELPMGSYGSTGDAIVYRAGAREFAVRSWRRYEGERPKRVAEIFALRSFLAASEAARDTPFWREIPNQMRAPWILGAAASYVGYGFAFHLLGVLLHWLYRQARRTFPPRHA